MTTQTTFYFNQLSDKAKDYARQQYQNERDYGFESELTSEDMIQTLEEMGFKLNNNGLSWQLSCSQGDYVGISGKINNQKLHELIMERLDRRDKKKYKFWAIDKDYIEIEQNIKHNHYYGQTIDITVHCYDGDDYGLISNLKNKIDEFVEDILSDYVDELCVKLKQQGYEQLKHYDSNEYIDECLNDFDFDEDGNII